MPPTASRTIDVGSGTEAMAIEPSSVVNETLFPAASASEVSGPNVRLPEAPGSRRGRPNT